ncbi:hypothetical protein GPECTOR_241g580 [Gonium pectorale]|uniref:Thiamine pyrophosphate enzyme N-terminal TPP-binding domain-containing protein n=1 Tax=Gonium pectorale TaxID=33097 RepID=A0A150FWG8_GONPE|nr:hypothetical protein GPECTOR_241g580 [Gonium pectorale]|eukprot:KXZ41927.1 hypothetical protein GPECTOR_241g580 [Gonium pectorale]
MLDGLGEIFAAEGYAKAAGRVGVCIATSGPGDTNLVTGLADGMMDSIPLVAITGQVPRRMIGTDAFQATPIVEVTHAITKHNYLVLDIKDLPRCGRPRPVLADVPKDIHQQLAVPDWDSTMSITGQSRTHVLGKRESEWHATSNEGDIYPNFVAMAKSFGPSALPARHPERGPARRHPHRPGHAWGAKDKRARAREAERQPPRGDALAA